MITYIQIDGFKSFRKFAMEFSPLTVIAGPNASGKSNLFDAIQLLSRVAEVDLKTAFSEQRGEAVELFTQYADNEWADEMSFVVEMLVDKKVHDKFGGEAILKYTRLKYELTIRRVRNDRGLDDLVVAKEQLEKIPHREDEWVKKYIPKSTLEYWRPKLGSDQGRRGIPYIKTEERNGILTIIVPQDGRTGNKREFVGNSIEQTILSSFNSVDFPHVFAVREAMRQWRFLQLQPEKLRNPSPYLAKDTVSQHGENLAAALHRIAVQDDFALREISWRMNQLLPNISQIEVLDDAVGKQFVIKVHNQDGREFSSRVLSEGTLRLLALCVLNYDEQHKGLICFEEPENGIHAFRIKSLAHLLKDMAVDFVDEATPLRQLVINTHSTILVGEMFDVQVQRQTNKITVWFSEIVTQIAAIQGKKQRLQITRMRPVEPNEQHGSLNFPPPGKVSYTQLQRYLSTANFEETLSELESR